MAELQLSIVEFAVVKLNELGQLQERVQRTAKRQIEVLSAEVELELMAIPGGSYLQGAPPTEEGWHPSQSPQHQVTIAPFWLGRYPVTQKQWSAVAALPSIAQPISPHPACFSGAQRPVEQVSWHDAIEFCARLSALSQRSYRLPSEAEWEYACRAGPQIDSSTVPFPTDPFHFGATISTDLANYSGVDWEYDGKLCSKGAYGKGASGSDRRETTEVGSFGVANGFGLSDMHGLVKEWCADAWHDDYINAPIDGSAWTGGNPSQRILRGGSWNNGPRVCRSAFRSRAKADSHLYDIGFRVACDVTESDFAS